MAFLRRQSRRQSKSRSGASAVEFAVVAPVFFLVVLGIIEFGRMVMVQQVITNAAREGARIAVLDSATAAKVTQRVTDYLSAARLSGATISISPNPPTSAKYDEQVSVEVRIPFSAVSAMSRPFLSKATVLTANSVMRRETVE
jgi:Flp pilus assembly protein TadG